MLTALCVYCIVCYAIMGGLIARMYLDPDEFAECVGGLASAFPEWVLTVAILITFCLSPLTLPLTLRAEYVGPDRKGADQ